MKYRIFGDIKPASKTKYGQVQAAGFQSFPQHGIDYTWESTKTKPASSRPTLRQTLHQSRSSILKAYASWRVGALEAEKRAHKRTNTILFTFDDYGSTKQINALLAIMGRESVRAAFFLQGDWAEKHPALVQRIRLAGHIIGNHTHTHADLLTLSDDEVRSEIAHGPESNWLRPPRGRYNDRVRRLAAEMGKSIFYWSIDSDDWRGVSAEYMNRKILRELTPGAVILFHVHADNTITLLPELIRNIRERGYEICSFDEDLESLTL